MSSPEFASDQPLTRESRPIIAPHYWPPILFFCGCMMVLLVAGDRWALPRVQDDAYYYLLIAKNIASSGRSEFLNGVPTNGYHPLWMAVLTATGYVLGFSVQWLKALELFAVFVGIVLVLRAFNVRDLLGSVFYTILLWFAAYTFALNGMETALLVPGLAAFIGCCASSEPYVERHRALLLGLTTVFCIGARIDSALVLLPMVALAPVSLRAKLNIAASLAVVGLVYAGLSIWAFGAPVPVSGMAKSIGGFQINRLYFSQLFRELTAPHTDDPLRPTAGPYLAAAATIALSVAFHRVVSKAQLRLLAGALIGMALFYAKIGFFSPWAIWPWYSFPSFVFVLLFIWILESTQPGTRVRMLQLCVAVPIASFQISNLLLLRPETFPVINRRFAEQFASKLEGRTVAMGDRAGSFAFSYPGGVFQLEGLVADSSYLEQLKHPGDLRGYLCGRNVDLVMSYERPLGNDYAAHRVVAVRSKLTTQQSPYVTVSHADELAQLADDSVFDEPDNRLYLWSLHCDQVPVARR